MAIIIRQSLELASKKGIVLKRLRMSEIVALRWSDINEEMGNPVRSRFPAGHARKACVFPRFAAVAACVQQRKRLLVSKLPTAVPVAGPARLVAIKNRGDRIRTCY